MMRPPTPTLDLRAATCARDTKRALAALQQGGDPCHGLPDRESALHIAARDGNPWLFGSMLMSGRVSPDDLRAAPYGDTVTDCAALGRNPVAIGAMAETYVAAWEKAAKNARQATPAADPGIAAGAAPRRMVTARIIPELRDGPKPPGGGSEG